MEQLKTIKRCLVDTVQSQIGDLKHTNAKELGEVIDMIKDLEEAMYYCSIIKAMEKAGEDCDKQSSFNNINYYMEGTPATRMYSTDTHYGYFPRTEPKFDVEQALKEQQLSNKNMARYTPYMDYVPYRTDDDDWRNHKLYQSRRTYVEGKMNHSKDTDSMQDLEHYIKDLGDDLTDMIQTSSPEEKQVLSTKLQQLAMKVNK